MKIKKAPQPGPSPTTSCKENDTGAKKTANRTKGGGAGGRKISKRSRGKGNPPNQLKSTPAPVMKPLLRQTKLKLVNCQTISVSRAEDEPAVEPNGKAGGRKRLSNQSAGGSPKKRSSITKKCSEGSMDIRTFLTPPKDQSQRPSTSISQEVVEVATPSGETNNNGEGNKVAIRELPGRKKLTPKRSLDKVMRKEGEGVSKAGEVSSSPEGVVTPLVREDGDEVSKSGERSPPRKGERKRRVRKRRNSTAPTSTAEEVPPEQGTEAGKLPNENKSQDAAIIAQPKCLMTTGSLSDSDSEIEDGEFEVEELDDYWNKGADGVPRYLVKWKGYDREYDTWEPAQNLDKCNDKILSFFLGRLDLIKEAKLAAGSCRKKLNKYLDGLPLPMDPRPLEDQSNHFLQMLAITLEEKEIKEAYKLYKANKLDKWTPEKLMEYFHEAILSRLSASSILKTRQQVALLKGESRSEELKIKLKNSEEVVNGITEGKPKITIENDVDLEGYPADFKFFNTSKAAKGIIVPTDPRCGCECTETCGIKSNHVACAKLHLNAAMPYNEKKRLRSVDSTLPIYECNQRCNCGPDCRNRVVQDGTVSLKGAEYCIFRTKNDCGWGVKTLKPIQKGTFVTLYTGELITSDEAEKRGKKYDKEGVTYLFDLDYNIDNNPYTIDAKYVGNISHFINHSCEPNLKVRMVFVDCVDIDLPLLALFATRNIKENEELSFDYLYTNNDKKEKLNHITCFCGTPSCRNKIF